MRDRLIEVLTYFPQETFVSLLNHIDDEYRTKGERTIDIPSYNILLWTGLSDEFMEAFNSLKKERIIELTPTHVLTYVADGGCLKLPLARSIKPYKKPHWIPISINLTDEYWRLHSPEPNWAELEKEPNWHNLDREP